jgi:prepilin-type N-terminal cleavage/methylation domain-containing protein
MKNPSRNSPSGFTIIELLVAMAITTIIVTVLVSVTSMAMDTWNRSRSEIRASRQAKSMIDSMARDLESFVSRPGNTTEWLYAKSNPSTEGPRVSPTAPQLASPNAIDLVFFTAATDRYDGKIGSSDDKGGDVSTVGYKLVYKDPIAGEANDAFKTFVLYRKLVDPDETFAKILGQTSIKTPFDNAGESIDKAENFICENVYQFTVTFHVTTTPTVGDTTSTYIRSVALPLTTVTAGVEREFKISGNGIINSITPRENISNASPDKEINTKLTDGALQAGRLTAVEISVTVLSDFGIQQMRRRANLSNTGSAGRLADFISKNSYQYTKVVQLPGF